MNFEKEFESLRKTLRKVPCAPKTDCSKCHHYWEGAKKCSVCVAIEALEAAEQAMREVMLEEKILGWKE